MKLYHGSSMCGLKELIPQLSEHGKPYVYFTSSPVLALLYAVKPVPKPFSYYPYGFEGETIIYSEYWKNAFRELYSGKSGYLYQCDVDDAFDNPTSINCVYTIEKPIKINKCDEIIDVYKELTKYVKSGELKIKQYERISKDEFAFIHDDFIKTIEKYNLKSLPNSEMSIFIKAHFPTVWDKK